MAGRNVVIYEDLGLENLEANAARLLEDVLDVGARAVERQMKVNIVDRGFVDTRATVNSVQVDPVTDRMTRDIGPTTEHAIYGEMGYHQVVAWGHRLKQTIYHPGLHFARDALASVKGSFIEAIGEAMQKLGGRRQ